MRMRQKPVDALGGGLESVLPGAGEALGGGVDAHHPDRVDVGAAQRLHHEVGADVARADQCGVDPVSHAPGLHPPLQDGDFCE